MTTGQIMAAVLLLASTTPAAAALVTKTYDYAGSDFTGGTEVPLVTSVAGRFSFTYDDTISNFDYQGPVTSYTTDTAYPSFALPLTSIGYQHFSNGFGRLLQIGGLVGGVAAYYQDVDFYIGILDNFMTQTQSVNICYSQTGHSIYCASPTSARITEVINGGTGGVPEPASWAMLIAGFGMVGAAMRRRAALA